MPARVYMEAFLVDAEDHLTVIDQAALSLEPEEPNLEKVKELFRAFHCIKGSAGTLALTAIVDFCHHVENLLDPVQKGTIPISPKFIDLILRSADQVACLLDVERGEPGPDPRLTQKLVSDLCQHAGLPFHWHPDELPADIEEDSIPLS